MISSTSDSHEGLPRRAIRHWPEAERPRERLVQEGAANLTDAQLLAILLRVGRDKASAVEVAMDLLSAVGGVQGLGHSGIDELCRVRGVGTAKAAQLKAAIELGKRAMAAPLSMGTRLSSSADVFRAYHTRLRDLRQECFLLILLDAKHAVLRDATVSKGSLTMSLVHPREVFAPAIRESAAAIVVLHNHPSGDPEPSAEDRALTARLCAAGDMLGIPLLDHVIIGDGRYVSFADRGWLTASSEQVEAPAAVNGRRREAGHARRRS
jgi:DNA repair protein RadC